MPHLFFFDVLNITFLSGLSTDYKLAEMWLVFIIRMEQYWFPSTCKVIRLLILKWSLHPTSLT